MLGLALVIALGTPQAAEPRTLAAAIERVGDADCVRAPAAIGCPERSDARYRLPLAVDAEPSAKDRALAQDGRACGQIGQTLCASRTRTIVRSGETLDETIEGSFADPE